jgi:hypothetical protein
MVRLCALLASFRSIFFSFIIVIMIVHSSAWYRRNEHY